MPATYIWGRAFRANGRASLKGISKIDLSCLPESGHSYIQPTASSGPELSSQASPGSSGLVSQSLAHYLSVLYSSALIPAHPAAETLRMSCSDVF